MKRINQSLLTEVILTGVFILFICSCSSSNYEVRGTFESGEEGDTVILKRHLSNQKEKLDTAIIKNGMFTFKGFTENVYFCDIYLSKSLNNQDEETHFFLEKGVIHLDIGNKTQKRSGTILNEKYQKILDSIFDDEKKIFDIMRQLKSKKIDKKEERSMIDIYNQAAAKRKKKISKAIQDNIHNLLGITLLEERSYIFRPEELAKIISNIKEPFSKREKIVLLKTKIDNIEKTQIGKPYVDFNLSTPEGEKTSLSQYIGKNKILIIDFWASWCGPCRKEMPTMRKIYQLYHKKGLEIIGVSFDEDAKKWKKAIKDLELTWPQMSDLKGWDCKAAQLYAIRRLPYIILIDKEGIIIDKNIRGEKLLKKLAKLYKGSAI